LKKVRICIFSTVQVVNDVRLFYREAKWLARSGYEVHLVLTGANNMIQDGIYFHGIKKVNNRFVRMCMLPWQAMMKALNTKSEIYHFHDPELLIVGFIMRWLMGKKVVFDMRESTPRQIMSKEYLPGPVRRLVSICYRIIEWICLKGIFLIVANDLSAVEHKKGYLVRNFPEIDEDLIRSAVPMQQRLERPLLVYLGGVWESRGCSTYIEIARRLAEGGWNFEMMIIGPHSPTYGNYLTSKIEALGLNDSVKIMGRMDYNNAMKYVCRAAIGLSILDPTPNHTFSLAGKMIEYMMVGTPVICSNFKHWMPYVEGEGAGKGVDPGNINEIFEVCRSMLSDKEGLVEMSRGGMEAVRKKYNWDAEFKVLLKCYEDMLGE
jgi:glycosyltransferase involved in cell wall biosynthesis